MDVCRTLLEFLGMGRQIRRVRRAASRLGYGKELTPGDESPALYGEDGDACMPKVREPAVGVNRSSRYAGDPPGVGTLKCIRFT